jgi:hypothetical protein
MMHTSTEPPPMHKHRIGLLFALVTLAVLVSIFLFVRGSNQQVTSPNLRQLLESVNCERACWLGIEPGVATGDEARTALEDANIQIETVELSDGGVYSLRLTSEHTGMVSFSSIVVNQITLTVDNICFSTVITEYGTPAEVQENNNIYYFLYPDTGLVFVLDGNINMTHITGVFLTSPAVFDLNFASENLESNWEAYKDRFSGECSDDLALSVLAEYAS